MRLIAALLLAACATAPPAAWAQADARQWAPLARDGLHDPRGPGLKDLQEPREALRTLPPDPNVGNQVRWVEALERGAIAPRTSLNPEWQVRLLDLDVYMDNYGSLPMVRFPHRAHTLWLDCSSCHDKLFVPKIGANRITMLKILQGQQCGQCHGAVSFPLTECARCHNTARTPENLQRAQRQKAGG
jgi:c(7)-type cytochrome triheme protein